MSLEWGQFTGICNRTFYWDGPAPLPRGGGGTVQSLVGCGYPNRTGTRGNTPCRRRRAPPRAGTRGVLGRPSAPPTRACAPDSTAPGPHLGFIRPGQTPRARPLRSRGRAARVCPAAGGLPVEVPPTVCLSGPLLLRLLWLPVRGTPVPSCTRCFYTRCTC